ncbi:serine/threonine-protein kinase [Streptomyces sp. NPDC059828]|uniref:serine/threonine-protein kinase n=1 Tax=Streptomyces sp. NPDC059828 TaxID=3346965 RepID=UPI0036668A47
MKTWSVPGFTEIRELGTGGSGRVMMAVETASGTPVAIKYLNERLTEDTRFLQQFRAEAELLREVDSPHVARLHQYVETRDGVAMVLDLVDGASLRTLLLREGATTPEAALTVLKGSLLGLTAAHRLGIVHRDYKPENVLVTTEATSKLVDFGIAARDGSASTGTSGTPMYMAPEQWQGHAASAATDVYAATVTFFECVTGSRPFGGEHLGEIAMSHLSAPVPAEAVPEPLRTLVLRGMAKDPADRFGSADEFLAELEAVAAAAYGPDWEECGRRTLAALAVALLVKLPQPQTGSDDAATELATTELDEEPPARHSRQRSRGHGGGSGPARKRNVAGAARRQQLKVPAIAAAVVLLGGAVVAGAVMSGGSAEDSAFSASADSGTSGAASGAAPGSAQPSTGDPAGHDPAASPSAPYGSTPPGTTPSGAQAGAAGQGGTGATGTGPGAAVPGPGGSGPAGASTAPSATGTGPAAAPSPTAAVRRPTTTPTTNRVSMAVSSAGITSLKVASQGRGADAAITVTTTGTDPVSLTLTWYNSEKSGVPGEKDGGSETYELSGRTSYRLSYHHEFTTCPRYWGLRISTTPVAESGQAYQDTGALACVFDPIG